MDIRFVRVLRTFSSERFLLRQDDIDVAALDIHYLADASVQATLIVFSEDVIPQSDIPTVLRLIDETLLPDVSLDDKRLIFTVVMGRVLGSFEPIAEANGTDQSR